MAAALGVIGMLALGCACLFFSWRSRHDDAFWRRVSANAAAGGAFSLPFALAMTRRMWVLGTGLILLGLSAPIGGYLGRLEGPMVERLAVKLPFWSLMTGTALIVTSVVLAFVERRKYEDLDPDRAI